MLHPYNHEVRPAPLALIPGPPAPCPAARFGFAETLHSTSHDPPRRRELLLWNADTLAADPSLLPLPSTSLDLITQLQVRRGLVPQALIVDHLKR